MGRREKEKMGRNSRETESNKDIRVGSRVEGQQEATSSLAVSVPGCPRSGSAPPAPGMELGAEPAVGVG